MLMAALNNKQLGINVNIRKSILDTPISPILWNSSTGWERVTSTEECKSRQRLKLKNLSGTPDVQTRRLGFVFTKGSVKTNKGRVTRSFSGSGHLQLKVNRSNSFQYELSRMESSYFLHVPQLSGKAARKVSSQGPPTRTPSAGEPCSDEAAARNFQHKGFRSENNWS